MHKRRIRYPIVYKKACTARRRRPKQRPYMMEILWPQWGRVYAESGSPLSEQDHFVRYRFFKHYRPRTGRTGWDMDKGRFWCSGCRRIKRRRNFNLIEWLR